MQCLIRPNHLYHLQKTVMKIPERRHSEPPLDKCAALDNHSVVGQSPEVPIRNPFEQSIPTRGGVFVDGVIAVQQREQSRGVDQYGGAQAENASSRASSCWTAVLECPDR